jgi:hypothetical protein
VWHGCAKRTKVGCTPFPELCYAEHYHPDSHTYACRQMVIDARIKGGNSKDTELQKYFIFKQRTPVSPGKPCLLIPTRKKGAETVDNPEDTRHTTHTGWHRQIYTTSSSENVTGSTLSTHTTTVAHIPHCHPPYGLHTVILIFLIFHVLVAIMCFATGMATCTSIIL